MQKSIEILISHWVAILASVWWANAHGPLARCANGVGWSRTRDKVGKNKKGSGYLSHTHFKLLKLGALEVSFVAKIFHL